MTETRLCTLPGSISIEASYLRCGEGGYWYTDGFGPSQVCVRVCSSVYNGGLTLHVAALIGLHGKAVNMEIVITIFYFFLIVFCFFPVLRWTRAGRDGGR